MKLMCSVCKKIRDLNEDEVKNIVSLLSIGNNEFDYNSYTRLLDVIDGNTCNDGEEHIYVMHDDFTIIINDIFKEHNELNDEIKSLTNREKKLIFDKKNLESDMDNIRIELDNINEKLNHIPSDLNVLNSKMNIVDNKFKELTGTNDYSVFFVLIGDLYNAR